MLDTATATTTVPDLFARLDRQAATLRAAASRAREVGAKLDQILPDRARRAYDLGED